MSVQWYVLWGMGRCLFSGMFYGAVEDMCSVVCYKEWREMSVHWYVLWGGKEMSFNCVWVDEWSCEHVCACFWEEGHAHIA